MSFLNQIATSVQDTISFYKRRRQFDDLFKYIRKQAPKESAIRNARELNTLLDAIVDDFAQQLRQQKLESLPIREVQQTFVRKWMGLTFRGTFRADRGRIEDLASVRRHENCVLAMARPSDRIFSFNLTLKRAVLEFEQYELTCGPINTKGRLSIEARENLISVRIVMELKKGEKLHQLQVTRAELAKCGRFKIRISGFGPFGGNSLAKVVMRLLLRKLINEKKAELEEQLRSFIKRTIESFTL